MTFEPEHASRIVLYWGALLATVALSSFVFYKFSRRPLAYVGGLIFYGISVLVLAVTLAPESFEISNLAAYGVFIGGPLILVIAQFMARKSKLVFTANVYSVMALLVVAIGIDAFCVEPHWLETTYLTLETSKLSKPVKIAVLSDIQIDHLGDYERAVLKQIMDEKPDLILMPGDYVQCLTAEKQAAEIEKFRAALKESGFHAHLGTYAVRGNVEMANWPLTFKDLPITPLDQTTTLDTGALTITALSLDDSFNPAVQLPAQKKFYIVFGHGPDFALAHPPADLLVAGHTHGGQVRLPGLGPIITLSRVPRSWAAGRTEIGPGSTLVVSRGVGMERRYAPRLRFLCRPELIFIALKPNRAQ